MKALEFDGGILVRLERGEEPASLDRELDARIEAALPPSRRETCREQVGRELEPYRRRMPAAAYEATLRRACAARLREELELPRLERKP